MVEGEAKGLCQYEFAGKRVCDEPVEEGMTLCAAHRREKSDADLERFREIVRDRMTRDDGKRNDFRGFVFPKRFRFEKDGGERVTLEGTAYFMGAIFEGYADFEGVTFKGDTYFSRARFEGGACFWDAAFEGAAGFWHATFTGNADFAGATFETGADFFSAVFRKYVGFENALVRGGLFLRRVKIRGRLDLSRAEIGKGREDRGVYLDKSRIHRGVAFTSAAVAGRVDLNSAVVWGDSSFRYLATGESLSAWQARFGKKNHSAQIDFYGARIRDQVGFEGARFRGDLNFENGEIATRVNLRKAAFRGETSFDGTILPRAGDFSDMQVAPKKGESLYRFAKQVCQSMGRYQEAGDWHYRERTDAWYTMRRERRQAVARRLCGRPAAGAATFSTEAEEKAPSEPQIGTLCSIAAAVWAEAVSFPHRLLLRWVFGYGERPLRVVRAMLVVILVCWGFYAYFNREFMYGREEAVMRWWEAAYFSVVTFTTLGYGDWHPKPGSPIALVTMAEAFAGVVLAALFVVTLARRWGRG